MATKKAKPVQAPPLSKWRDNYTSEGHDRSQLDLGPMTLYVFTVRHSQHNGIHSRIVGNALSFNRPDIWVESVEEGKTKVLDQAKELLDELQAQLAQIQAQNWVANNPGAKE